MKVYILNKNQFINSVIPKIDEEPKAFFISILDPETGVVPLREDSDNYRSYSFFDLEEDMDNGAGHLYKAITEEQAKDMYEFIKSNSDKEKLFVHCSAGISRSGALGAFVHEYFGGAYKELLRTNPHILPNGRVTRLLRMYERSDAHGYIDGEIIKFT